ncbi:MAG: SDR family NAD(P)-dependent oxidoreductase [Intestinibacter bartlettii]|nr:SDR family NAD(P)-dependent oxidoreductase [Intestinibacter bartlettii]
MNILVTGGAGYIGSHTSIELINAGYEVIIVDNLCNSNFIVVDRIQEITGKKVKFYKIDATNKEELKNYKSIGITAGASTPDWIISDVIEFLESI